MHLKLKPFMKAKVLVFHLIVLFALIAVACINQIDQINDDYVSNNTDIPVIQENDKEQKPVNSEMKKTFIMKGVDIDIPVTDFAKIKNAGFEIITTEWGMEEELSNVKRFLDRADSAGLKVVLDGGFSYTAWGFTDEDWIHLPPGKKPVWQKEKVQKWVREFKDHPSVCAWDICNEYGENLPSGQSAKNTEWPDTVMTLSQLQQARRDILDVDPDKPVLIRTYVWNLDEPPFGKHRQFESGIAEIVMINLYSNYLENGNLQWPDVISDIGAKCAEATRVIDPNATIWISLAAFSQPGIFQKPATRNLVRDIEATLQIPEANGIAFFAWGPTYAENKNDSWYLPQTGSELWDTIKNMVADYRQTH